MSVNVTIQHSYDRIIVRKGVAYHELAFWESSSEKRLQWVERGSVAPICHHIYFSSHNTFFSKNILLYILLTLPASPYACCYTSLGFHNTIFLGKKCVVKKTTIF